MVNVGKYGDSKTVTDVLLEEGVITVPGVAFGKESEGFLRVSFCAEKDVLTEGVRRIGNALTRLRQG
jgi:aspartate/methionine/tyrosine aminotransferase